MFYLSVCLLAFKRRKKLASQVLAKSVGSTLPSHRSSNPFSQFSARQEDNAYIDSDIGAT